MQQVVQAVWNMEARTETASCPVCHTVNFGTYPERGGISPTVTCKHFCGFTNGNRMRGLAIVFEVPRPWMPGRRYGR